ncbi:carboxypeptidase D [Anabrus simplex]|uniref:carboxypeptidase D n=1 Tax=Anabrus simplex TaxID=316456 RepID=UPI0035A3AB93
MALTGALLLGLTFSTWCTVEGNSVEFPSPPELKFEYHKHEHLKQYLNDVSEAYPNLTTLRSIGKSSQGRELLVLIISAAPEGKLGIPNIKFVGNIHGNEPAGRELILHLIQFLVSNYSTNSTVQWLLQNTRIHMLPSVNPDGFEVASYIKCRQKNDELGRKNHRRVDLNRNFPDHFRKNTIPPQVETTAVIKWLNDVPFILSASLHGGALVANYPFDNTPEDTWDIASKLIDNSVQDEDMADIWKRFANVTGAPSTPSPTPDDDVFKHLATVYSFTHPTMHKGQECPGQKTKFKDGITNGAAWYSLTGGMQDYNYVWHGCFELTLEISCCKYPKQEELPTLWQENKEAMLRFTAQAHHGIQGLVMDYETNETIPDAKLWIDGREISFNSTKKGEFWRILLPGNYTLIVTAKNYRNESIPFEVFPYEDDFGSTMTWVNVSLISLDSTVSVTKSSTVFEERKVTPCTEVSSTTDKLSQNSENATQSTIAPKSTTKTLLVNGTVRKMHYVEQFSASSTVSTGRMVTAQKSQHALCLVMSMAVAQESSAMGLLLLSAMAMFLFY